AGGASDGAEFLGRFVSFDVLDHGGMTGTQAPAAAGSVRGRYFGEESHEILSEAALRHHAKDRAVVLEKLDVAHVGAEQVDGRLERVFEPFSPGVRAPQS